MINFCHISPTKYIGQYTKTNGAHLILAHLVETDYNYTEAYSLMPNYRSVPNNYKIMDNSAFEMFKQGRPMYDYLKLIEMGTKCKADCIILSDYPREDWTKTVLKAVETIDDVKHAGFDTFFVPQSTLGDIRGYIESIRWALNNPKISRIGLSILACPIAIGIDEQKKKKERDDAYKMHRYLSRLKIFSILEQEKLLGEKAYKKFHCLGMTDGPNEITLLERYHRYIVSWDSSAAIWSGLNGISFDNSPTGLQKGKFEKEVDFKFEIDSNHSNHKIVQENINYIDDLIKGT
jgi:hypothetical protein